jgi:glycerol-3-phosphate dehydrogenase
MGGGWREAARRRLDQEEFDLLVVGGGATGAGIARDAATRGLRVALCERGDFACQTSSRSSRLIHGGLRYLQHGDLPLVFEALSERRLLLQNAPHLCRPVEFLYPAYAGTSPSARMMALGVGLYDALALWRPPVSSRHLPPAEVFRKSPWLRSAGLQGAQQYIDCQTDDARLVLEYVLDAVSAGAVVLSQVEVISPRKQAYRRLSGLRLVPALDLESGERLEIRARLVINATGPFCDSFALGPAHLRPSKGVHLVLDAERLPHFGRATVVHSPRDGRLMFVLPAGPRTIVGTTETDWPEDGSVRPPRPEDAIVASPRDVEYLLETVNHAFPPAAAKPEHVISAFAGLRPLVNQGASSGATSREHAIWLDAAGILNVGGGKLTTTRAMAEEIANRAIEIMKDRGLEKALRPCQTRTRPLPGAGPAGEIPSELPPDIARHIQLTYGARAPHLLSLIKKDGAGARRLEPGLPYIEAELAFAVRFEFACELDDVLCRRVPIGLFGRDQGAGLVDATADILAAERGWSGRRRAYSVLQYRSFLTASRSGTLQ